MPEISQQHVERLEAIVRSLTVLAGELAAAEISVPPEIQKAVADKEERKVCLVCGDEKPKRYVRGQCGKCESAVRKWVNANLTTEAALIKAGKMTAQPKKGGRVGSKAVELDALLTDLTAARAKTDKLREREKQKRSVQNSERDNEQEAENSKKRR